MTNQIRRPLIYRYQTVGFDLGNGLFFDLNSNLSLLVPECFGLEKGQNFNIEETSFGFFGETKTTISYNGAEYKQKGKTVLGNNKRQIEISNTQTLIHSNWMHETITKSDSGLLCKSGLTQTKVTKTNAGYDIKVLWDKACYTQSGNSVNLDDNYMVRYYGDVIEISKFGLFMKEKVMYTLIKTNEGLYFYDKNSSGVKVVHAGDEIEVYRNQTLYVKYKLH